MTQRVYDRWLKWEGHLLEDPDLGDELRWVRDQTENQDQEITDRFYKDLEFGTGGLRGIIGVGSNRLNIYTVAKATQGYMEYLKEFGGRKVAIAYDSRIKSELFAKTAAEVFAAGGAEVLMFSELMPTPVLSYAIRYLNCDGGIVITASHNPAEYNGYKVYGSDGGQITDSVAKAILNKIKSIDIFEGVQRVAFDQAVREGKISYINSEVVQNYLSVVSEEAFDRTVHKDLSIVYTPLNGTGLKCVLSSLERNGFSDVTVVEEQRFPDGNFPTCRVPNPEKKEALQMGIEYAEEKGVDLVLATDPDCDRVGIAVKTQQGYELISGNEMGVLLLNYICMRRIRSGKMPERPICMKTIVTTDLACKVGESYGVEVQDVLTGFKYIGEKLGVLEKNGEKERFILGIEESYGYLTGTYVRDKDGVNASLLICEMAAYYKKQGKNLVDVLKNIYEKFGYCVNTQYTYRFEGAAGTDKMKQIMDKLRDDIQESDTFLGNRLVSAYDYLKSRVFGIGGKNEVIDLPKANVCKMVWEDGTSLVIRPSGTEPKLKIYIAVEGNNREEATKKEYKFAELVKKYINSLGA